MVEECRVKQRPCVNCCTEIFRVWGQMFILLHPYQLVLTIGYLHVLWDHLSEKCAVREVLNC